MMKKLTLSSLALLALFLTVAPYALANTVWYVNGANGNDASTCKTAATACKTIGRVVSLSSSGDSIIVAAATYKENLHIAVNLTISGSAARTTIIDGGHKAAVVTISTAGAHVNLSQLTLRNGSGLVHGGGGIYNVGALAITNATVSGNNSNDSVAAVGGLGGGIYNAGTLTIFDSTISGNNVSRARIGASAAGGGIYNTGSLTITNSTLSANQAADYWPAGAPYGGGIDNENGALMINNSTLSQNAAIIYTPLGSAGSYGGGIYNHGVSTPTLQNSIVAGNTLGGNCDGSVKSLGHNLSSDNTCNFNGPGDQRNINPKLGPLQNNGGPTPTMGLLAGSPAIDAGNPSGCTDGKGKKLTTDQRGAPRPVLSACDIGAYNH